MKDLFNDFIQVLKAIDSCECHPSEKFIRALIVAEDHRFMFHLGADPLSIVRATCMTLFAGRLQGASTIEAQLVRTITGRREITFSRKIREIIISTFVSIMRPKQRIASTYLSVAYFGFKTHGISYAADRIGFSIDSCAEKQIFFLVAMLRRPFRDSGAKSNLVAIECRAAWIARRFYRASELSVPRASSRIMKKNRGQSQV